MTEHNHSEQDHSNVVALTDKTIKEGGNPPAQAELERKRHIAMRAFQITAQQIEADALKFEEGAILGNHDIMKRHQMMDQARAFRMTSAWLMEMAQEAKPAPVIARNEIAQP